MNKETYEALKEVINETKKLSRKKWGFYNGNSEYYKEIEQVENWIEEVAEDYDYDECHNKDENGNACWNCEMGDSEDCGLADKEMMLCDKPDKL